MKPGQSTKGARIHYVARFSSHGISDRRQPSGPPGSRFFHLAFPHGLGLLGRLLTRFSAIPCSRIPNDDSLARRKRFLRTSKWKLDRFARSHLRTSAPSMPMNFTCALLRFHLKTPLTRRSQQTRASGERIIDPPFASLKPAAR